MPMPRRSGGTATPAAASLSARPASSIRPALGISSPAIMRSVVVLPHPDGPSSVISSPFAISRSRLRIALEVAEPLLDRPEDDVAHRAPQRGNRAIGGEDERQDQDRDDAGRGRIGVLLQREEDRADGFGARAHQQDRHRQLAERRHEHEEPSREDGRPEQRQPDRPERVVRKPAPETRAASSSVTSVCCTAVVTDRTANDRCFAKYAMSRIHNVSVSASGRLHSRIRPSARIVPGARIRQVDARVHQPARRRARMGLDVGERRAGRRRERSPRRTRGRTS